MYIHELDEWPQFKWDQEKIAPLLIQVRHNQGQLMGGMGSIGFPFQEEVLLQTLTQDVVKTSEIEGEILNPSSVRSSVARRLGIENAALDLHDRNVEGIVEMMLNATQLHGDPLTKERLFHWHSSLFPKGTSGYMKIHAGAWRKSPIQVVSGRFHKEIIHFEGPGALLVEPEMASFLSWLNHENELDLVLKAAIAHLWFITIHPFDDGNGRIARAIADLLLARSEKSPYRFYSLSAQIQQERKSYYQILEQTQKGKLDITPWLEWFLHCLETAINKALLSLHAIPKLLEESGICQGGALNLSQRSGAEAAKLKKFSDAGGFQIQWLSDEGRSRLFGSFRYISQKGSIWKRLSQFAINERQRKLINHLLDGFHGKLTTSKWAKIAKCSQDTAYRDISNLIEKGILSKGPESGRSTHYILRV